MVELLTKRDLRQLLKVSEPTLRKLINSGRLPEPIDLGDRTKRWRKVDIEKWILDGAPANHVA